MASGRIKGITIELGADASKFTKALAEVDKALSKTQTNLRDINKALKLDPGNTSLLKDRQVELANAIDDTKKKLETEKQALEQMKNTEGFDANSEAARNLQTQIDLDTAALKELEAQARQASSVLGTQMQVAGQKIQEVGNKIKSVGDSMANFGRSMTTYVTAPIVGAFTAAVKTTGDFDEGMSRVQAISGATGNELDSLRSKALEMAASTKFSATESADALNYMAMAGWKTEQMMDGLEGIMNLAAASGEDLATTSDIVTDALTAFGLSADQSGRFADVLAATAANANTNVAMMGESFKYVAPVAGALGYSIEDVSLALGLMANSGIKADMAGTSLRNMLNRMAKPTKESAEAMERLGIELYDGEGEMFTFKEIMDQLRVSMSNINISVEDYDAALDELDAELADGTLTEKKYAEALEELNLRTFGAEGAEKARAAAMLGGTRAMSGLLAIANASTDDYNKLADAINNSAGAAENMANTMLENLPGQMTILKSKIESLAISFGDILMPYVMKAVDTLQGLVDKFNAMDDAEKKQIIKIAAIVAAIGPALLIIGKIISGVGSLVSIVGGATKGIGTLITAFSGMSSAGGALSGVFAAMSGPIGIVVAAITALVAGFTYLFNTNEEFRASIMQTVSTLQTNLAGAFESLQPALASLKKAFDGLMEVLAPFFEMIFQGIAAFIAGIASAAGPLVEVVTNIITIITSLIQAFLALLNGDFEGFKANLMVGLQAFIDGITAFITAIVNFWVAFFQMFGVNLQLIFTNMWNAVKLVVTNTINTISTIIRTVWTAIKTWITTILTAIQTKFEEIFDKIKEGVSERISAVKDLIVEKMEAAAEYISSLPKKFYDWGVDMIQSLIDGIQEKIDFLRTAISEVAGLISSYIHFSEPDVGPLSNFHTFMPDMMNMIVAGINQGIPRVAQAMDGLAQSMIPQAGGQFGVVGNSTNTFNINVYGAQGQNVSELADVIEQRITENVMRRGVAFG